MSSDLAREIELIRRSGLFDEAWYLAEYPDVEALEMDAVEHYLRLGARMGRNPSVRFDTEWYLERYPDVLAANVNPLLHYMQWGMAEGRKPRASTIENLASTHLSAVSVLSPLKEIIREAEAATRAEEWSEAVERWRLVLTNAGDQLAVAGRAKLNISIASRLSSIASYKRHIAEYHAAKRAFEQNDSKRIAVYTAIAGSYDSIKLPERMDPRFDYILFTDKPAPSTGVWEIRPITYFQKDPTRAARFVKTHPHLLLPGFDIAVWIDSNIMIIA